MNEKATLLLDWNKQLALPENYEKKNCLYETEKLDHHNQSTPD